MKSIEFFFTKLKRIEKVGLLRGVFRISRSRIIGNLVSSNILSRMFLQ